MSDEVYSRETYPAEDAIEEGSAESAHAQVDDVSAGEAGLGEAYGDVNGGIEANEVDDEFEEDDDTDDTDDTDDEDDVADEESEDHVSTEENSNPDVADLSDEDLDQIADTAIAALEDILKYFDLGEVTIDEYEGDEGELILDITGEDLAVLIGRHGKTLDALQFIISSITARTMGYRYPVVVDVEGYKGRQRQKLENLAFSTARRALSQSRSVKMRPMTPYERRIVHIALREFDGVSTASEGEGSSRHVVVVPD